jgi:hypothetical protein
LQCPLVLLEGEPWAWWIPQQQADAPENDADTEEAFEQIWDWHVANQVLVAEAEESDDNYAEPDGM